MTDLVIHVDWEYFLGIVGSIVALAYYANGRFTRLETSVEWLKETVRGLKVDAENATLKFFEAKSPVSLTDAGHKLLYLSGLQSYIDSNKDQLVSRCQYVDSAEPYEFQRCAFRFFADLALDPRLDRSVKQFAFSNGVSTDVLRRAAAIYLIEIATATHAAPNAAT